MTILVKTHTVPQWFTLDLIGENHIWLKTEPLGGKVQFFFFLLGQLLTVIPRHLLIRVERSPIGVGQMYGDQARPNPGEPIPV